ncbi:AsnC family transcriptional regulator [Maridesulfovibrio sp.]|uniref:siroheme decarboxylase subunit alpha n=1 Tax=Maridesulfovibrio sp. TaxID=2795000 RepID=UPI0029CA94F8|nr:AsnC family transcriptional regulator [Maridesulfovibrio sp.]
MTKLIPEFDELDCRILNILQTDFPLCSHPYAEIGKRLGITEEDALSRVTLMRENGTIRRIGANFDAARLGWVSTLCAANVAAELMNNFVEVVNAQSGVTHNYLRSNKFNIWFTLTSPSRDAEAATLESITQKTGVKILNLPASRLVKVRVDFKMGSKNEE